jgi:hypothetical protein
MVAILVLGSAFFTLAGGEVSASQPQDMPGPNSAIRPTPVPTSVSSGGSDYVVSVSTGATIVPGTTSAGIDCQFNCTSTITLPFPFTLYDRTFTTAIVGSNGILGFVQNDNPYTTACLPSSGFNYAIVPGWEQMVYRYSEEGPSGAPGESETPDRGVFTSITGNAPNRIFNIEWRARDHFNVSPINFEVRLYENSSNRRFDVVYAQVNHHGGHAVVGVQKDTGSRFTQFSCLAQGQVGPGVQLTFTQAKGGDLPR